MVHSVRRVCGRRLFEESPVECDIVSTVPESATPAAVGYAAAAGVPFEQVRVFLTMSFSKSCAKSHTPMPALPKTPCPGIL
jgi:hypothetical protein